jgi:hypothetical protein
MKPEPGKAKNYIEFILGGFGYAKVEKESELKPRTFFTGALGIDPKTITIIFFSEENIEQVIEHFTAFSIEVTPPNKRKPHALKFGIKAVYKAYEVAHPKENQSVDKKSPVVTEAQIILFAKEKAVIENLLNEHGIAHTADVEEKDPIIFVTYAMFEGYEAAKKLLTTNLVDYVSGDQLDMYISLALPEALLQGILTDETAVERNQRNISEFDSRLRITLVRKLEFVIRPLSKASRLLSEKEITFSGDNGTRRINFNNDQVREKTMALLSEAGFHCEIPTNKEREVIIVDLHRSEQKELLQNMGVELLSLQQVKERIAAHGLNVTSQGDTTIGAVGYNKLYFATVSDTNQALELLKDDIEGVEAYLKCIRIPKTSIKKPVRGGIRIKKTHAPEPAVVSSNMQAAPKKELGKDVKKKEPETEKRTSGELFINFKALLRQEIEEEIRASHDKEIASLKKELTALKDSNYLVPKEGDVIVLPLEELSTGGIMIAKEIVIKKSALFHN